MLKAKVDKAEKDQHDFVGYFQVRIRPGILMPGGGESGRWKRMGMHPSTAVPCAGIIIHL
jgi:hypothetical protein